MPCQPAYGLYKATLGANPYLRYNEEMNERTKDSGDAARLEMQALLDAGVDREASGGHLIAGHPVTYRIHGRLEAIDGAQNDPTHRGPRPAVLSGDDVRRLIESILPEGTSARREEGKNFDC